MGNCHGSNDALKMAQTFDVIKFVEKKLDHQKVLGKIHHCIISSKTNKNILSPSIQNTTCKKLDSLL
jgi:hypothetical protein